MSNTSLHIIESLPSYIMTAGVLVALFYFIALFVKTKGVFMRTMVVLYGLIIAVIGHIAIRILWEIAPL